MGVDHRQFGTFCCVCMKGLKSEECAVDKDGVRWDVCKGECAREAGVEEVDGICMLALPMWLYAAAHRLGERLFGR